MKIGYACIAVGVRKTNYKSCILKNINYERLVQLISHNLCSLENIIDYNIKNNIDLFRITSDLIPFGSSKVNDLDWENMFKDQFTKIGEKIKKSKMRVSMHPGQYTVLNSPKQDVVDRAIEDLKYHTKVLESLGVDQKSKIILHVGGVYGDKSSAMDRFIGNYKKLNQNIKKHLIIENDDKSYTVEDILSISKRIDIPLVFDNLHHEINSPQGYDSYKYWIDKCNGTWKTQDGDQKIHYSQQNPEKRTGSHSETIDGEEFLKFVQDLDRDDIDIMLEVKDKNISAIKCKNITTEDRSIKKLEKEWCKYKYKILESSHKSYLEIRNLLKDKKSYPVLEFYKILDSAIQKESSKGGTMNAATHIWGYFKDKASDKEKESFMKKLKSFEDEKTTIKSVKTYLLKLAEKYGEDYIIKSYYFYI